MINGNIHEFMDHIYYGDELWFLYRGTKYFLEDWPGDKCLKLYLFEMIEGGKDYCWKGDMKHFPAEDFLKAKIWDGKSFWEVEQEIEWVDG